MEGARIGRHPTRAISRNNDGLAFLVNSDDNRRGQAMPLYFTDLVQYFLVPIGVLFIAYVFNHQFRLKYSSGSDFYVFFVSLDLNAIIVYSAYKDRINPRFAADYLAVFVLLVVACLFLLGIALETQTQLDDWRSGTIKVYPFGHVFACWFATVTLIPTHLFIFFGR
ncbi:MAG: hypothetical protein WCC97_10765 [Candidatus Acidiferrales bacterium]